MGKAIGEVFDGTGYTHCPNAVSEMTLDLADHTGERVRRKTNSAIEVEPVDGFEQPYHPDLEQIIQRLPSIRKPPRDLPHRRRERFDQGLSRPSLTGVVSPHQLAYFAVIHSPSHVNWLCPNP